MDKDENVNIKPNSLNAQVQQMWTPSVIKRAIKYHRGSK